MGGKEREFSDFLESGMWKSEITLQFWVFWTTKFHDSVMETCPDLFLPRTNGKKFWTLYRVLVAYFGHSTNFWDIFIVKSTYYKEVFNTLIQGLQYGTCLTASVTIRVVTIWQYWPKILIRNFAPKLVYDIAQTISWKSHHAHNIITNLMSDLEMFDTVVLLYHSQRTEWN